MRRCIHLVLLAALLLGPAARAAAQAPIVAVFDLEVRRLRLNDQTRAVLSDYLADRLASSRAYAVVPRDQLKQRLRGQKKASYQDCYAQTCQIAIGQELAAQKSLASKVMKIGGRCVVTLTLYDLKKSTTEAGATATGACTEEGILASLEQSLRSLVGSAAPAASAAPPPRAHRGKDDALMPPFSSSPAAEKTAPRAAKKPLSNKLMSPFRAKASKPSSVTGGKPTLSRSDIQAGMRRIKPQVARCYKRFKARGTVLARVTIVGSGVVRSVTITGALADTPTGACVASAVRRGTFPQFTGKPISVTYPFVLR